MSSSDTHTRTRPIDSTRRWVNANPALMSVACIACMLVLMAVVHSEQAATTRSYPTHEWYYDTVTGELVPEPLGLLPPLKFGDGELWRARMFTCDGCEDSFVGYYEKLTPEAKRRLDAIEAIGARRPLTGDEEMEAYDLHMSGWLFSLDGKTWRPRDFQADEELSRMVAERCPDGARPCWPQQSDLK